MTGDGYPANAMTMPAPRYRPPRVGVPLSVSAPPRVDTPSSDPRVYPPLPRNGFSSAGYGPPPSLPAPVSPLATLSVVFAFAFPPVGIVLGHVALSQIRYRGQTGRDRALTGLTLSYIFSVVAVMTLIVMAATASTGDTSASTTDTSPSTTTTATASPTTTETTPPTTTRPRQSPRSIPAPPLPPDSVNIEDLRIGDCVEVHKDGTDPTQPQLDVLSITRATCENRVDVYRVDRFGTRADDCPGSFLVSSSLTLYVCISKVSGT